jgi:hypothetical protein
MKEISTMNAVNARLLTCVATTALGLLCIGQTALAEQTAFAQGNCKEAKGNLNEVFFIGDNFNSGILRN